MNKKIISLLTAATVISSGAAVITAAAETTVKVVVDNSPVEYEDQQPIIENDRTLIPVRGAFEAMGGTVEWDGENRTVTVKNSTNTVRTVLTIDSDVMTTYTYKSLLEVEKTETKLDVPATIKNDRTMLPLRAVGEAMGAKVEWDGESYTASIITKEISDEKKTEMLALSLSQAKSENEGEVVVSVDLKNIANYPDTYVGGVTLGLNYDPEVLEFVSTALYNGDTKVENAMGADNPEFKNGRLKSPYVTVDEENAAKADGSVMKVVFKKLKDEPTSVSLSDAYHSKLGYDTSVMLGKIGTSETSEYDGTKLNLDKTPLELK